jgi:CDP-glucose 4,6-dehydratase
VSAPDPAFWRGRRVLVTGHTGFKGAWLALWLHRLRAQVTGFAGPPPSRPALFELSRAGEGVESLEGDVRDPDAVANAVASARPELVLHLAAQPLVRRSLAAPAETYAVNVLGTAHVLDAVRAAGNASVVVVTSDKCYANVEPAGVPLGEHDRLGGRDPYSSSKAAQELVAAAYRESYGMRIATARAGNVIGGGDWAADRLVPDLMRAAVAGTPLEIRNPAAVRPWQHVLNPLAGYLVLAERLAASGEYAQSWNFGPAEADARPVSWVVDRLRAHWPEPLEVRFAAPAGEGVEAPVLRLDSTAARERLGWRPRWALEEGLAATARWHAAVRDGADPRAVTLDQLEAFVAA